MSRLLLKRLGISRLESTPELERVWPTVEERTKGFVGFACEAAGVRSLEARIGIAVRSAYLQGLHDMSDTAARMALEQGTPFLGDSPP